MKHYYVYLLECRNGKYYVGQTENLENRFEKHLKDPSKQIMKMQPVKLLGSIRVDTRSQAMKLEKKMKAFKRRDRILSYFRKYGGCSSVG